MKTSSNKIINEDPLLVLPSLAVSIGLQQAIVLQQIHFWIKIAQKNKEKRKFIDGRWWVYNTYKEWKDNFPWWSEKTIYRIIRKLEDDGYLLSREMNVQDWDHTKWYSIDYDKIDDLDILSISEQTESPDQTVQDVQILIPETTTETTTKNNTLGNIEEKESPEVSQDLSIPNDPTDFSDIAKRERPFIERKHHTKEELLSMTEKSLASFYSKNVGRQVLLDYSNYPADIYDLAVVFSNDMHRVAFKRELGLWIEGLRDFYSIGVTPDLLHQAYQLNERKGLSTERPQSLKSSVDELLREQWVEREDKEQREQAQVARQVQAESMPVFVSQAYRPDGSTYFVSMRGDVVVGTSDTDPRLMS